MNDVMPHSSLQFEGASNIISTSTSKAEAAKKTGENGALYTIDARDNPDYKSVEQAHKDAGKPYGHASELEWGHIGDVAWSNVPEFRPKKDNQWQPTQQNEDDKPRV